MPKFNGKVLFITPPKVVSEKMTTQEICLDTSVEINGTLYESSASMQVSNKNCEKLDNVQVGDEVEVTASINGFVFIKKEDPPISEKNPEGKGCITKLSLTDIKIIKRADGRVYSATNSSNNSTSQSSTVTKTGDEAEDFFKED